MAGFDTVFPADSVEFCPHPDAANLLVCGTYQLDKGEDSMFPQEDDCGAYTPPDSPQTQSEAKQSRRGECLLLRVDPGHTEPFSLLQETSLPAVLDMKWCHTDPSVPPTLAIAESEGDVTLHTLQIQEGALDKVLTVQCAPEDVLCLSLDWSNRRFSSTSLGSLVTSLSDGDLALLRSDSNTGLTVTEKWHAHDYEPWIAAWNYWDNNVVYSGGDDLKMKAWDIRRSLSEPIFVNKRFDAGVTTIQSHPYIEHLIAVGSYDSTVRLFDTRKPLTPLTQAEVGGGVWRVKWHPTAQRQNDLLVACMHDGFKIVRFNLDGAGNTGFAPQGDAQVPQWQITKRFDEHTSLAYGVDWSFGGAKDGTTLVASCSFYDHTLHWWKG
ncbi:uncharacterized protein FIBRA_00966 [Fibroporia radiculosa]|uniref:methylated diphthine methylhydrolase n=1 Tax=Fibroporia radiculosa TaxID=599839 RepID=J4G0Q2_9APHY|nr:uncharacterized protein FIBRA_00966 [Fibroporia radiculosa]CCL98958.1 predicted protein [Fibroporia radiculosa]